MSKSGETLLLIPFIELILKTSVWSLSIMRQNKHVLAVTIVVEHDQKPRISHLLYPILRIRIQKRLNNLKRLSFNFVMSQKKNWTKFHSRINITFIITNQTPHIHYYQSYTPLIHSQSYIISILRRHTRKY